MTATSSKDLQPEERDSVQGPSDSGGSVWLNVLTALSMLLCLGGSSLAGLAIGTALGSSEYPIRCAYSPSMTSWTCSTPSQT